MSLDAVDLLLDGRGHRVGHDLGVGPGIDGRHLDGGRGDLRVLRDRQRPTAMPPARVTTIDSTAAKIGRSMKNLENTRNLTH